MSTKKIQEISTGKLIHFISEFSKVTPFKINYKKISGISIHQQQIEPPPQRTYE